MLLIKNANIYAPSHLGNRDVIVGGGKIESIRDQVQNVDVFDEVVDLNGAILTPGFIDQHVHVTGAGGKRGFSSMSPEIKISELLACGTTTVVGLLGTDGTTRSIKSLYAKVKALDKDGISAYMYTGYYGLDPNYIMESVKDDIVFIDKVIGCKIAITDIRSSFPSDIELLRILSQLRVGGMLSSKKGILHIHLGNLTSKMDVLFKLVEEHEFPIEHISPTHVGRTEDLFHEAIRFAKMGGMIDITTGASKFTDPFKSVLIALENGVDIDNITFSSDGNAGLDKLDDQGNFIGFRRAPVNQNYKEVVRLVKEGKVPLEEALKLITINPAKNLGLKNKGGIEVGMDADFCCLNNDLNLLAVFAKGKQLMENGKVINKDNFA
ncbi:MAG: beta-aspartyl-peptidase [Crocinitomicaceae bacterium TMED16]|nr:MAG: beta-aspartyl-peptidase [Crocinitomicaceae bacterium TMED16]